MQDLKKYYPVQGGSLLDLVGLGKKRYVKAVENASFVVPKGSTLGIVGESGCGKSTLVKTIIGLEDSTSGKAEFMGFDITGDLSQRNVDLIREVADGLPESGFDHESGLYHWSTDCAPDDPLWHRAADRSMPK